MNGNLILRGTLKIRDKISQRYNSHHKFRSSALLQVSKSSGFSVDSEGDIDGKRNVNADFASELAKRFNNLKETFSPDKFTNRTDYVLRQMLFTLRRRMFYLHVDVTGLFSYGPLGCAIKSNVLNLWRKTFVTDETMEIECPSITPERFIESTRYVSDFFDPCISVGPPDYTRYLRPQAINSTSEHLHKNEKFPFGVAHIGQSFKIETCPVKCKSRLREFTLAEIVNILPIHKFIPKFQDIEHLEFLHPTDDEIASYKKMNIMQAVSKGAVSETMLHFICVVYLFLTSLGINREGLRFRQLVQSEIQSHVSQCWDIEILSSMGWLKCVGIAEKHASMKSVQSLVAIETSVVIDSIIYCLFEHSFCLRKSKDGNDELHVFRFPPLVAPIKCTLFTLLKTPDNEEVARVVLRNLKAAGIVAIIDTTANSIGKIYAKADEIGVPLAINVFNGEEVRIRERDSKTLIRVRVDEVTSVLKELTDGQITWADMLGRYPSPMEE